MPGLFNVKRVGVACTYGGTWWTTQIAGDPIRRYIKRSFLFNCAPGARCDYVACHDMNHTTLEKRSGVSGEGRARIREVVAAAAYALRPASGEKVAEGRMRVRAHESLGLAMGVRHIFGAVYSCLNTPHPALRATFSRKREKGIVPSRLRERVGVRAV